MAFGVAGLFLFASTATMNLAVLESVPPLNRPFAIAFSTLLMHLFGRSPKLKHRREIMRETSSYRLLRDGDSIALSSCYSSYELMNTH